MLISFQCPHCDSALEAEAADAGSRLDCPACGREVRTPVPRVGPGTTLGNFAILSRIGSGGMGEVYLARQVTMDRRVALKVLPRSVTRNPQAIERFRHEVRMAARLEHPNIVTAFEAGEDFGYHYLAMAYVDGEDLRSRLKTAGVLPEREALTYARQVADALGYAWNALRMLHRDVKPANIMVDRQGRARIMDLGISKSLLEEDDDAELTASGMLIGTPHYMSPEQASSGADLDCRADIYSLGATLYHLLGDATPYSGTTSTAVVRQIGVETVRPLRELNSVISEPCARLVQKMMTTAREQRQGSWEAVLQDIDRVLAGRDPLRALSDTTATRVATRPPADAATPRLPPASPTAPASGRVVSAVPPRRPGPTAMDTSERQPPPRLDLRRQRRRWRLRQAALWSGAALAIALVALAARQALRARPELVDWLRQRLPAAPATPATEAPPIAAAPAPTPTETPDAPPTPAAAEATPATLDSAATQRLDSAVRQAVEDLFDDHPDTAAEILKRAGRDPSLASLSSELFRAAALAGEGRRADALVLQSLQDDLGRSLTLRTRHGSVRLRLNRIEEGVLVGIRMNTTDDTPMGLFRIPVADLSREETLERLRRFAGRPAGDLALALALCREGRGQEALEPIARLPQVLQGPFRERATGATAAP